MSDVDAFSAQTSKAGEIYIIKLKGNLSAAQIQVFAGAVQEVLNAQGMNLVLDLEDCQGVGSTATAGIRELGVKLARSGGALMVAGASPELFEGPLGKLKGLGEMTFSESRGMAMSQLLNRLSVRGELLTYIRQSLAVTYLAPHDAQPVACTFLKNLQNFLVFALEPPFDGGLKRGMVLRFTLTGCGEEGTQTIGFDAQIYQFGQAQDGTPCLIVKVPDLLEISEDRRQDPRVPVRFRLSYYAKTTPDRKSYGTMVDLSIEGASFTTTAFDFREGQAVMIEPEFRTFKLQDAIELEVLHVRHQGGEILVGGKFLRIAGHDQERIGQYILNTSKW